MHFSYDLESTLTDEERAANEVLQRALRELRTDFYNASLHDYFDNYVYYISRSIPNSFLIGCP